MHATIREKKDLIAQWAFDTRPILGRFHLWLDDVEVEWLRGTPQKEFTREISFVNGGIERLFAMTGAVTALGTQIFGRFGEGAGLDKTGLNQVKKDADAISAYIMSESLWYLTRQLPENHAIMVSLGEGLMPKAGETPEMGSNPLLGFGRVYARPEIARWLDRLVQRLINDDGYGWDRFYRDIADAGVTIWGTAIDTLENTSRFAKGKPTGPMTILHLFNQPLHVTRPYEGYMGNLFLPEAVVEKATEQSILINFNTPRSRVLEAIEAAYPGISRKHIHVWTLRGKSRQHRIGGLWKEWESLGVHLVDDGWKIKNGQPVFTDSGTYAPTYSIGDWVDENGQTHLFFLDGYAASAEAMQAASLAPMLGLKAFLSVFTSTFKMPYDTERQVMHLDPDGEDFPEQMNRLLGTEADEDTVSTYRDMIHEALDAGIPLDKPNITADDFFPEKKWDVMAISGYMRLDPYSDAPGVEEVEPGIFRVVVRQATTRADKRITFTLRLMENREESRLVFSPLLNRFFYGQDYETRPIKISDSGRIRNELQTLCTEALEFYKNGDQIRIHFDRIPGEVISPEHQRVLLSVLSWYKQHHPLWFSWLEIVPPGKG